MPVTIVRTDWLDDDGTGTTGTVINNAWKTELYNQIDGALAKVAQLAGANTFTGNQTINGTFSVVAFGTHSFSASGSGEQALVLRNTAAGGAAVTTFYLANDARAYTCAMQTFSSTYVPAAGYQRADGTTISQAGAGGLIFACVNASGPMEFWTSGFKRWWISPAGELNGGPLGGGVGNQFTSFTANGGGALFGNVGTGAASIFAFYNANGPVGGVQTSGTATAFLTSSDARLKTDRGLARDTTVLERTEIHDYEWIADGTPARGVFSQDAHEVAPFANIPGTDERDDEGRLLRPWSTDYSKYVPDLIVGWQQHAAALAALRAEIAALKGLN
jgi:hypothetical protein